MWRANYVPGAKSLIVFVSAGGKEYVATAGTSRPKADQRFRIGSVTKTFTATIVLQLVQEGTLGLDSTLEDHVPGVVPRGEEITIRHLLQHRSGLADITEYPEWLNKAERSPSTSPINSLRFAASKPLAFKPGTRARYSNTNYIALGLVIEKVTGRSYAEELEQRVLDPLGLDADGAADDAPPRRISKTVATTRTFPGRRARSSRTRTTSPASTPPSSPGGFSPALPSRR